jgi:hypothetical protein
MAVGGLIIAAPGLLGLIFSVAYVITEDWREPRAYMGMAGSAFFFIFGCTMYQASKEL